MTSRTWYPRYGKRLLDLTGTLALAPFVAPVSLAVALLVRIDLGPPVLFTQKRTGLGNRPFVLRKFRTMKDETDASGESASDSERISHLGNLLRRLSLDELPELINVVKGDMSLVGPRPLLPRYLELYSAHQARRHEVLPGLTGLAQVRGRNALTWEEKLQYDVEYVERLSFRLDLAILLATCWAVLSGKGITATGHATMPEFRGTDQSSGGKK